MVPERNILLWNLYTDKDINMQNETNSKKKTGEDIIFTWSLI